MHLGVRSTRGVRELEAGSSEAEVGDGDEAAEDLLLALDLGLLEEGLVGRLGRHPCIFARFPRSEPLDLEVLRFERRPSGSESTTTRTARPRFHAVEPIVRPALEKAYRAFEDAYRAAAADFVAGREARFPAHSLFRIA